MKTMEECLRNNWNSINKSKGEERQMRISFQNSSRQLTKKNCKFYEKYLWNEETK